jgi:hypothetical protein
LPSLLSLACLPCLALPCLALPCLALHLCSWSCLHALASLAITLLPSCCFLFYNILVHALASRPCSRSWPCLALCSLLFALALRSFALALLLSLLLFALALRSCSCALLLSIFLSCSSLFACALVLFALALNILPLFLPVLFLLLLLFARSIDYCLSFCKRQTPSGQR